MLSESISPNQPVLKIAVSLAHACKLAYDDRIKPDPRWYYDVTRRIGEVKYRILSDGNVGILAIAGSDSVRDFLAFNTDTHSVQIGGFQLHKGFVGYAQTVLADLRGIDDLPEAFARGDWYCCGHSLGSAAAGCIPYLLQVDSTPRIESPCGVLGLGVPNFAIGPTSAVYPITNAAFISSRWDLVARVPVGTVFRKYSKPNCHYWVDNDGISTWEGNQIMRVIWYLLAIARMLTSGLTFNASLRSLDEHKMDTYIRRVTKSVFQLQELLNA